MFGFGNHSFTRIEDCQSKMRARFLELLQFLDAVCGQDFELHLRSGSSRRDDLLAVNRGFDFPDIDVAALERSRRCPSCLISR